MNKKRGFTIVEMLVAVSILLLGTVGPMYIAFQGITIASTAKARITAIYLAQEGMEFIKNIRDTNILSGSSWDDRFGSATDCQVQGIGNIGCTVDVLTDTITKCTDSECDKLQYNDSADERIYGYGAGWPESSFTRTVKTHPPVVGDEIQVDVKVEWNEKGKDYSVEITDYVYSYQ